jgi:putative SOS response-associated peptidase YedK
MPVIQPSEADMQARVVYAIARQDGKPLAFAGIWETF